MRGNGNTAESREWGCIILSRHGTTRSVEIILPLADLTRDQWVVRALAISVPLRYALGMNIDTTAIERAFELARSGRYETCSEIKQVLVREGYSNAQITGPTLMRQLRELINSARQGT